MTWRMIWNVSLPCGMLASTLPVAPLCDSANLDSGHHASPPSSSPLS